MSTKAIYIFFAIAILGALIFTIEGILATKSLADTEKRLPLAINADAERLMEQANRYKLSKPFDEQHRLKVNAAEANRLASMADFYAARQNRIISAQANRLTAQAGYYAEHQLGLNKAQSKRLTKAAEAYLENLAAQQKHQERIRQAETARWTGLAAHYLAENP